MKTIKIIIYLILAIPVFLYAEYPQKGWTDSVVDGIEQASKEDKYLLLYFGGTDWCSWCIKLDKEVFSASEFREWAERNAVLVLLDFPSNIKLSDSTKKQNNALQAFFGVRGYPTVFLLDSDMYPLLRTGYKRGGAVKYIEHLENDRNIDANAVKDFPPAFQKFIDENVRK